ncbi:MAG: MBL fold metallo-hydrolase [Cyanobacteria bacterium P01_C01_bin.69]
MNRRNLLKYAGATFAGTLGLGLVSKSQSLQAQSGPLTITALGHTSFLFTGSGQRVLVNPFKAIGCTAGYAEPSVGADLVLLSSRLFDEGFLGDRYASSQVIDEPGDYTVNNQSIRGVSMPHDRIGGRRFGTNVAWVWNQAGVNVVHLGGAAAPISIEDKILIGRPDVLLIPVGGGPKAYTPEEAVETVQSLNPKIVIPTHYRTQAADADTCDIVGVDEFVTLMAGTPITQGDNTLTVGASNLSESMRIEVLSYAF